MRKLTELVSEGFIWGVGITRPDVGRERTAARYITGILVGSVCLAVGMFFFLLQYLK